MMIRVTQKHAQFFLFSHRYSRVLRGDLATEHRTNCCERRQQARCVGGNFPSSHYRLEKICLMFTLYLVSHMLLCAVLSPAQKGYSSQHKVSLALLHGETVSVTHGGFDSNLEIECQPGGKQEGGITWVDRRRGN